MRRFVWTEYAAFRGVLGASKPFLRAVAAFYVVLVVIGLMLNAWVVVLVVYGAWIISFVLGGWALGNAVMHLPPRLRFVSLRPDQIRRWMLGMALGGIPVAIFAGIVN